ncbi:MAG TPA: DegV family protein [Candidatus Limiplasma sp.]|nr:DegV family protein [Candidatus Limiplasma sp.]HPR79439.1 DegV family protein [Candidatus Limiplasma sp.]
MNSYVFMTDSDSDLPFRYVDEYDLQMVYMPYIVDGVEYFDDLGRSGKQAEYFQKMREGMSPVTSLLPTPAYLEYFEPILAEGRDILFIAFSSHMSSTINNIFAARDELLKKYPDRTILVVDTLSISAPMSLLLHHAYQMYTEGKSMQEIADWVLANRMRAHAWLTVDDLKYLKRGGRISAIAATMGTMLDLKPIIIINREGSMAAVDKVRGRKAALRYLADKTAENIENPAEQSIVIIHADAKEDADRLEGLLRERIPTLKNVEQYFVGPVIGAHCGPGTVACCFMGKERAV